MEQVSYNLRLDLKDTGIVNTGFRLKQGDSGMKISVSIFNRGVNVFDSTTVPKIVFKRPDGASVMANMTVGSSVYEYVFVGNELQQPGVEIMDVKFTLPNDRRESTVSCSFVVVPDTITPNTHGSDIYDNDLAELVAEATAAAETVEEVVGDSEAWAVGERNGVPVGPEDPAYHNNSKWWSEQANVTSLAALTDVDLDNPTDNDGLVYDSTSQKWENKPVVTGDLWAQNGAHNLLYNRTSGSSVVGGLTMTTNGDKSITVGSGTTTSDDAIMLSGSSQAYSSSEQTLKKGTYTASINGGTVPVYLVIKVENDGVHGERSIVVTGSGTNTFTIDADCRIYAYLYINAGGQTSTGGVLYPMIKRASDPSTTYTPFAMTNVELTEKVATKTLINDTTVKFYATGNVRTLHLLGTGIGTSDNWASMLGSENLPKNTVYSPCFVPGQNTPCCIYLASNGEIKLMDYQGAPFGSVGTANVTLTWCV